MHYANKFCAISDSFKVEAVATNKQSSLNTLTEGTTLTRSVPFPEDTKVLVSIEGKKDLITAVIDSGASISLIKRGLLTNDMQVKNGQKLTLISAFNTTVQADYSYVKCKLVLKDKSGLLNHISIDILCAVTDDISDQMILSLSDYTTLLEQQKVVVPHAVMIKDTNLFVENKNIDKYFDSVVIDEDDDVLLESICDLYNDSDIITDDVQTVKLNKFIANLPGSRRNKADVVESLDICNTYSTEDIVRLQKKD